MKVIVIGYNPKSGPYSYGSVSVWAYNSWERLRHQALMFDRSEMDKLPKKADIYFFADVSEDYSKTIPDNLEGLKIFWNMDMQMPGGMERAVNISRKVDYTFCTNYEFGVKLLKDKFNIESTWIPYGYDKSLMLEVRAKTILDGEDYDVCMIGNANSPERIQLWDLLNKNFKAITGTIDTREEYVKAKARSKIVINQPTAGYNNIINLRVWNATACNKLLLCKRTTIKEMDILGFRHGFNVVYWDEFDDLVDKIKYYLSHDLEREMIASEGAKLGEKYLMDNSIRNIEQVIYSKFYERLT